jgi:hypothetical protein
MREEPPINAKCKDKFLVQSAFIAPDDEIKSLGEMVRPRVTTLTSVVGR